MKRKLTIFLGCEAALIAALLLTKGFPAVFSSLMAFPFEQIAAGMKALGGQGRLGGGLAAALWAGVSALPLLPALRLPRGRETAWERAAWFALSGVLLFVLYRMAAPAALLTDAAQTAGDMLPVQRAVLGAAAWSGVLLCVLLRILRLFRGGDTERLFGYLRWALYALCAVFTAAAVISCGGLSEALKNAQMPADGVFAALRFLTGALPYVLDIAVTFAALELLDAAGDGEPSGVFAAAERLSGRCCAALGITVAATAGFNLLQVVFMRLLSQINTELSIPVVSIVFIIIMLLLARLLAENKRLRDDNDLFI
ncbi:MAG: hypothetical protein IJU78_08680 [Clostridia bacterium]|nr:hypothetical protein [Clostridia bacterium]